MLNLDDMREEFARFLGADPAARFRMDAALAHVITLAYSAGLAEGAAGETDALRGFAQSVMEAWPAGGVDGGDLQEIAAKHGLLMPETRHQPCGESCGCNEFVDPYDWEDGVVCYRKTALLLGANEKGQATEPLLAKVACTDGLCGNGTEVGAGDTAMKGKQ